ncbi:hypothetical protein [Nitrolancea hollandica]|uniref:Uncharacterized protein n=1 Tax=Nitrolancea hollandica Lb TaxID=1129897 RepID=I4EFU1_9BACT|nr:hypothetical protein [Nitrolancea hollandica]CCF83553.1 hypothetical protein NITHO_2400013 [Nitrolancea hollandica Lb]
MNRTTVNPVEPGTETEMLDAALGVLAKIRREYQEEERRVEDWFEVEDREMHAYHRGKTRGLLFCIQALETNLKLVGALPGRKNVSSQQAGPVLPGLTVRA